MTLHCHWVDISLSLSWHCVVLLSWHCVVIELTLHCHLVDILTLSLSWHCVVIELILLWHCIDIVWVLLVRDFIKKIPMWFVFSQGYLLLQGKVLSSVAFELLLKRRLLLDLQKYGGYSQSYIYPKYYKHFSSGSCHELWLEWIVKSWLKLLVSSLTFQDTFKLNWKFKIEI